MSQDKKLILTARHCIELMPGRIADPIRLYFTDPESQLGPAKVFSTVGTVKDKGDGAQDWALLEAKELPAWKTTEVRLLDVQATVGTKWTSFGYPGDGGEGQLRGQDFGGSIRSGGTTLPALLDATAIDQKIAGLSGGPAIVEEYAIGIITRAEQTPEGFSSTGMLYVLPLASCPRLADHVRVYREPAFLEATASAIANGSALADVVRAVCLEDSAVPVEGISQPHRHLALWLLLERLRYVKRVVVEAQLPKPDANEVVEYAACQWYPPACASKAAERLIGAEPRVVSVECCGNDCASRFVRRGGFEVRRSRTWHLGRIDSGWLSYEPVEALVDKVGAELAHRLGVPSESSEEVSAALSEYMTLSEAERMPVVYWTVLPPEARDDVVDKLRGRFPDLGIIVLGPPRTWPSALTIQLDATEARKEVARLDTIRKQLGL